MKMDNSIIVRERSKIVELLSFVNNYVIHKTVKGLLTFGWADGYSFVSVGFNMIASWDVGKRSNIHLFVRKQSEVCVNLLVRKEHTSGVFD